MSDDRPHNYWTNFTVQFENVKSSAVEIVDTIKNLGDIPIEETISNIKENVITIEEARCNIVEVFEESIGNSSKPIHDISVIVEESLLKLFQTPGEVTEEMKKILFSEEMRGVFETFERLLSKQIIN